MQKENDQKKNTEGKNGKLIRRNNREGKPAWSHPFPRWGIPWPLQARELSRSPSWSSTGSPSRALTLRILQAWDGVDFHIWFRFSNFLFGIFLCICRFTWRTSIQVPCVQESRTVWEGWGGGAPAQGISYSSQSLRRWERSQVADTQWRLSGHKRLLLRFWLEWSTGGKILFYSERERSSQTSKRAHGVQERGIGSRELKDATLDQGTFHSSHILWTV